MKKENLERAKELFEKEAGVDKVYFTKDGNMFRALHYAEGWDKDGIETVSRALIGLAEKFEEIKAKKTTSTKVVAITGEAGTDGATTDGEGTKGTGTDEGTGTGEGTEGTKTPELSAEEKKAELVKTYIELFDKKPNHMAGVAKLKEQIAEKEALILAEITEAEKNKA